MDSSEAMVTLWSSDATRCLRLEQALQAHNLHPVVTSSIAALADHHALVAVIDLPPLDDPACAEACAAIAELIPCIVIVRRGTFMDRLGGRTYGQFADYALAESDEEELTMRVRRNIQRISNRKNPPNS